MEPISASVPIRAANVASALSSAGPRSRESASPGTLSGRTARAGIWAISGRLISKGLDFVSLLVLARVLGPADFGLVAMAITVILVVETIMDLPLTAVLVREESPSDAMFGTAFTLGLLRGLGVAVICGSLAWPLAQFYQEPRLVSLVLVGSLAPILRGMQSPRMVLLQRRFEFRPFFALDVLSKLVSLATVFIVVSVFESYWAIAAGTIATSASAVAISYWIAPLRPMLTLGEWHRFASTLGWNTVSQTIQSINWQLDRMILPRFVDVAAFGRFTVANDLAAMPYQAVAQPAGAPLMSAFVSTGDRIALQNVYMKATGGLALAMAPIFLCMSLLAEPILAIMFDQKWGQAAPMLAALALASIVGLPAIPFGPLAMSMNRTHLVTLRTTTELIVKFPVMLAAISAYGIFGAIITQAVAGFVLTLVSMLAVRSLIGLGLWRQIRTFLPTVGGLAVMAMLILSLRPVLGDENIWLQVSHLAAIVFAAFVAFAVTVGVAWSLSGKANTIEALIIERLRQHLRYFFKSRLASQNPKA